MKKTPTIILAVVACVAIIISCVFGVQKGNIQKTADETKAALESQISELTTKAAADAEAAQTALETAVADAKTAAAAELETAVEAAKTAAATELATAKSEMQATIDELTTAKGELETQLASMTEAKTALETQLAAATTAQTELQAQVDALTATDTEKEKLLTAANKAKADLETQLEAATTAQTELSAKLETAKVELQNKIDEITDQLDKTKRALNAAKSNAYLLFVNADQTVLSKGTADSEDGAVKVTPAAVNGEGEYSVGLEFAQAVEGLSELAISIKDGQIDFTDTVIKVTGVFVNDGENILTGEAAATSDDGVETKAVIYGAEAAALVDPALFTGVTKVTVNFELAKGEEAAPEEPAPTEEAPAEEKPAEEAPAEEKPAEEAPAEEKPAEEAPAEGTPAEEKPAEEKPAEGSAT